MHRHSPTAALTLTVLFSSACASHGPAATSPEPPHHHELNLPPVGPGIHVAFGGRATDVVLANVLREGESAPLLEVWKSAFPGDDPAALHFDLVGSDGFHPASRAKCTRLLTGQELAHAKIDVASHNVTFDDSLDLPGCYRVKAVVSIAATP